MRARRFGYSVLVAVILAVTARVVRADGYIGNCTDAYWGVISSGGNMTIANNPAYCLGLGAGVFNAHVTVEGEDFDASCWDWSPGCRV